MSTNQTSLPVAAAAAPASRLMQLGLAALLGLFIIGFAGFAPLSAVHNAAHDARHSLAFPCH
jgi:cobalt transporter subunit CbtB